MLPLFCVLALVLGQGFASHSANQYVDTVIDVALQNAIRNENLDPTHLFDFIFDYHDKTFFGKVHGKAEYSEGSLSGLSRVKRYSECDGPKNVSSETVINCTLVFQSLDTRHKGKVKYGKLPKVSINAKGNLQNAYTQVGIVKSTNDRNARVKTFSFSNTGSMSATFSGLGPLNKQMKNLEDNYKNIVGPQVISVIRNRFQYALNRAVAEIPMPLQ